MKTGDVVKVLKSEMLTPVCIGMIVNIKKKKKIFSDKYSIVETVTYLHILTEGKIEVFDLEDCAVQVINESR